MVTTAMRVELAGGTREPFTLCRHVASAPTRAPRATAARWQVFGTALPVQARHVLGVVGPGMGLLIT